MNKFIFTMIQIGSVGLVAMAAGQQPAGNQGAQTQLNGSTVTPAALLKPRMKMDQFLAILPKTLGRYKLGNNGVYQDMKPCNRIERAYFAGDQSMIVEVRDTGGFTDDFIRTKQYLSLKVGKKTVNKYEVLLLDGHRALLHNDFFGGGNMIEIAWDDRYEIEIKSKFEDFDSLKKFAFEIGSNLTRASSAGAQVK